MVQHFYHYIKATALWTLPHQSTYVTHSGIPAASALGNKGQLLMQEARPTSGPIWQVVPGNWLNSLYNEADAPTPFHLGTTQRGEEVTTVS